MVDWSYGDENEGERKEKWRWVIWMGGGMEES